MNVAAQLQMSDEEYLDYDDRANSQTELRGGLVYTIDDSTEFHSRIVANLSYSLQSKLVQSGSCFVMTSPRVRAAGGNYLKPDVAAYCGQRSLSVSRRQYSGPLFVIEVLSPSTRNYDRGDKFELYREMESVAEYAVVEQDRYKVDVYRRMPEGRGWHMVTYQGLDADVEFVSIRVSVAMRAIYLDIDLAQPHLQLVPPER